MYNQKLSKTPLKTYIILRSRIQQKTTTTTTYIYKSTGLFSVTQNSNGVSKQHRYLLTAFRMEKMKCRVHESDDYIWYKTLRYDSVVKPPSKIYSFILHQQNSFGV